MSFIMIIKSAWYLVFRDPALSRSSLDMSRTDIPFTADLCSK